MTLIRAVSAGEVSPDTALVEPPSLPALLGKLTLLPLQTVLVTLLSLVLLRPVTRVVPGGPHQLVQHHQRTPHEVHRLLGHLVVDDLPGSSALLVREAAGGDAPGIAVEQLSDLDRGVQLRSRLWSSVPSQCSWDCTSARESWPSVSCTPPTE